MALIRAEVRDRLGSSSIYDCVVESLQDFSTEPMLDRVHAGSIALCLNCGSQSENDSEEQNAPACYIKSSDGSWKPGSISNAHLMNLMESLMAQKIMGLTGGSGSISPTPGYTSVNSGEFVPATDTYEPAPIAVLSDWDHFVIWTEDSFLLGRRNINGAVIWKKSDSTLAYKVMYTNISGTAGIVSQLLNGGPLYYLEDGDASTLHFGSDVSFGVYAAGTTYKWAAWKEGA